MITMIAVQGDASMDDDWAKREALDVDVVTMQRSVMTQVPSYAWWS